VPMYEKDFQVLRYFVELPKVTAARGELRSELFDCNFRTRTVDVHVVLLRQKLEPDPNNRKYVLMLIGFGYRFMAWLPLVRFPREIPSVRSASPRIAKNRGFNAGMYASDVFIC
jgi:hypothetical protein